MIELVLSSKRPKEVSQELGCHLDSINAGVKRSEEKETCKTLNDPLSVARQEKLKQWRQQVWCQKQEGVLHVYELIKAHRPPFLLQSCVTVFNCRAGLTTIDIGGR